MGTKQQPWLVRIAKTPEGAVLSTALEVFDRLHRLGHWPELIVSKAHSSKAQDEAPRYQIRIGSSACNINGLEQVIAVVREFDWKLWFNGDERRIRIAPK